MARRRSALRRLMAISAAASIRDSGDLPAVQNMADMSVQNIVIGRYINNSGAIARSDYNFYMQSLIPVAPNAELTMHTSREVYYFSFIEYDSDGNFIARTLYGAPGGKPAGDTITQKMGETTTFIRWGANPFVTTPVTLENILEIEWMLTASHTTKY